MKRYTSAVIVGIAVVALLGVSCATPPAAGAALRPVLGGNAVRSAPLAAPLHKGLSNVYIGALHSIHTTISDGKMQYPNDFYSTLKPLWDWVSTTEHDFSTSPEEWQSIVENSRLNNSRDFASLTGYEWTSPSWGHMSVVYRGDPPSKPAPASAVDPAFDTPKELYTYLARHDGLAVFAHPALPRLHIDFNKEADYRDDGIVPLAGMFGFGGRTHWNVTWDYADGRSTSVRSTDNVYSGSWIKTALERGYRLGFVSEPDWHDTRIDPGAYRYTGVVADSLTRDGIFDGLKERHVYAVKSPSGIGKKVLVKANHDGHLMGDEFAVRGSVIEVTLQGKTDLEEFTQVNLFVNGTIVQTRDVAGQNIQEKFTVGLPAGDNYTFFEVRARSADDQLTQAVTSPMFVRVGG